MKWKDASLKTRLNLIAAIVLIAGLAGAGIIYMTAGNDSEDVSGHELPVGDGYTVRPEDSKTYRHGLELYGGKVNLLADEFSRWFEGLWEGKSLAYTIALVTVVISSVIFFVAGHLHSDLKTESSNENNRSV